MEPTGVERVSPAIPSTFPFFSLSGPIVKSDSAIVLSLIFFTMKENEEVTIGSTIDSSIGELLYSSLSLMNWCST